MKRKNLDTAMNPQNISMQAKEMLEAHGSKAEHMARENMQHEMSHNDVYAATFWMSVIHEIQTLSQNSSSSH